MNSIPLINCINNYAPSYSETFLLFLVLSSCYRLWPSTCSITRYNYNFKEVWIYLSLSINGIIKHNYIIMDHLLEDLDLPNNRFFPLSIDKFVFVINLNSQRLISLLMMSFFDNCISALTQNLRKSILSNWSIVKGSIFRSGKDKVKGRTIVRFNFNISCAKGWTIVIEVWGRSTHERSLVSSARKAFVRIFFGCCGMGASLSFLILYELNYIISIIKTRKLTIFNIVLKRISFLCRQNRNNRLFGASWL